MLMSCQELLQHTLLFDIEVNERNEIYSLGAVLHEKTFQVYNKRITPHILAEFDEFSAEAQYLLGHNILKHDLPRLQQAAPSLQIFTKPKIDTLFLSPLAFPANPYHRLVKNYQIVRDSINDPVQDAALAGKVFTEQWEALVKQFGADADVALLYRAFLASDSSLIGTAEVMGYMGIPLLTGDDVLETFSWFARKHCCVTAVDHIVLQLIDEQASLVPLAYVTAWLSVADGNSVLPPWVRHQFPQIAGILHQLRESNCRQEDCVYCQTHHDPKRFLLDYYGFSSFRSEPQTSDRQSLQEEITHAAARDASLFATLPTGGGKSLCYLLPALMRYQRRNMLTIVISPLQALMKDQVDNFSRFTGTRIAAALYGMLTMPERKEVLEGVRLGDIGILLVSPEQLRNASFIATVGQREIGAWVFDEAHCLSKWGHDFRPDYLYAIRFIREFAEREKTGIPPVQCFTATAKKDVRSEIIDIIQGDLGLRVVQFAGGHERTNLQYEVLEVNRLEKYQTVLDLLRSRYEDSGSVVIYCATRKGTERLAEFLQDNGFIVEAFHAGLEPPIKKQIQESFITGVTPIICATNAFGMGIDKEDVRLVIHADIPGSLENYLQEAGRAGRDRQDAHCILIFNEQDIEGQFRLSAASMLSQREIALFLRGLRHTARGNDTVILTAGDLVRLDVVEVDPDLPDADTRVRTALAWLERAGYLQRDENKTKIFQGKPTVKNLEEAAEKIATLNLSERQQQRWLAILRWLMAQNKLNQTFSADELAGESAFASMKGDIETETETQRVIRTLHDMSNQGILENLTLLSAYIRYKVQSSSEKSLQEIVALENDFLKVLIEASPDVEVGTSLGLDLRQVNQMLLDRGHKGSNLKTLELLLHGIRRDGKGLAGSRGSVSISPTGGHRFTVILHRDWPSILKTVELRQIGSRSALEAILAAVPAEVHSGKDVLVEFTLEQIVASLRGNLLLADKLKDPLAAAERALTYMHELGILNLQQGLAVFRQAMTIKLHAESKSRRYSQADFLPLKTHYAEKTFQIHVMNEYARLALTKLSGAWQYVASYFNDDKEQFVRRFFPGREKLLERATSKQSYQRIVTDLNNRDQEKIVTAGNEKNMLVLAGPGAGKTRVVAHRVAYLLRVARINSKAILVLCFNRSSIVSLRQRLHDLIGNDMMGVTLLTFHGLALRLTGRSLVTQSRAEKQEEIDFAEVILEANRLLKGESEVMGFGDIPSDYALVGRFSHILVDEYQDIDAAQYELVSLVAGKSSEEGDRKMAILAVGDDDQNIYRFRGASIEFIRKFQQDYDADVHYLIENYRSTANVIAAANCLIAHNSDRMKTGYPICINKARKNLPAGGNWQQTDSIVQGRVQILDVKDSDTQATVLLEELQRLSRIGSVDLSHCAVLAREWKDLDRVRSQCEDKGIPVSLCWGRHSGFPRLTRIKENAQLLEFLREIGAERLCAGEILTVLEQMWPVGTLWSDNLRNLLLEWQEETNNSLQPVSAILEYLYEVLTEQGRSKSMGNGLFLATAHAVKGLEFDHVFILGDSWQGVSASTIEDERRLYYVSMSRARETLHLFSLAFSGNPHTSTLSGDFFIRRKFHAPIKEKKPARTYHLLGMEDVFIDFAGLQPEQHPTRLALREIKAGDAVHIDERYSKLELVNKHGITIARLSRKAQDEWADKIQNIKEVRVVALVQRYKKELVDKTFQARCKGETWEVPIVEVVC